MSEIRLAIAGVGNCASALVQGIFYYKNNNDNAGLLYPEIGGYKPSDVVPIVAFDIDERKVGKDLSQAIFEAPNCTLKFYEVPYLYVPVLMSPVLDGVPDHLKKFIKVSDKTAVDIGKVLKETRADVLINILPTGSALATRAYADACLKEAKVGFINGIPEMIASDPVYARIAKENSVPLIGDDFKSQIGSTIIHRNLIQLLLDRGIKIDKMYQYNFAGNTDFANLENRGETKEITKTEALKFLLPYEVEWGFAPMFINGQEDIKTGVINIKGRNWGGNTINLELKIEVNDSANAAGVMIDMIRFAKFAMDNNMSGLIEPVCAYYAKHPPIQTLDKDAKKMLDDLIKSR